MVEEVPGRKEIFHRNLEENHTVVVGHRILEADIHAEEVHCRYCVAVGLEQVQVKEKELGIYQSRLG